MPHVINDFLGKIHHGDCVAGLKSLPDSSVHLAFADPPFNIGYDYDEYDDRLDAEKYIAWAGQWMSEIHRVLVPNGSFWLAIGDEYAAELKLQAQQVGFHSRNWVVWYYTFGVHCKHKFTRSHAHLFYFVKDAKNFTFSASEIAVPSARQLVYADARANPKGRLPDDTWILRPQDCVDGFNPDEDTWYFPRVNGTFKERAGFHGCQMPEQLLGRILKACSEPNQIVLDPFSGSATTLVVAKKLGRQYLGFELSTDYYQRGTQRLSAIGVGDKLEGAEEPKVSAPTTAQGKPPRGTVVEKQAGKKRKKESVGQSLPGFDATDSTLETTAKSTTKSDSQPASHSGMAEAEEILACFAESHQGHSVDRLIADPELNQAFQSSCDQKSLPGTAADRNRFLFRLRKAGRVKQLGLETSKRTDLGWQAIEPIVYAAEIAWRIVADQYAGLSLDDILCDPRLAQAFDDAAAKHAPGHSSLHYRWAALKFRKELGLGSGRADRVSSKSLGIRKFKSSDKIPFDLKQIEKIAATPAIYAIRVVSGNYLYLGETENLQQRLQSHFQKQNLPMWESLISEHGKIEMQQLAVETVNDYRLARQATLLKWYSSEFNFVE